MRACLCLQRLCLAQLQLLAQVLGQASHTMFMADVRANPWWARWHLTQANHAQAACGFCMRFCSNAQDLRGLMGDSWCRQKSPAPLQLLDEEGYKVCIQSSLDGLLIPCTRLTPHINPFEAPRRACCPADSAAGQLRNVQKTQDASQCACVVTSSGRIVTRRERQAAPMQDEAGIVQ